MMNSLSLLAAVFVSLLCTFASAHVADSRKGLDNNIQPNAGAPVIEQQPYWAPSVVVWLFEARAERYTPHARVWFWSGGELPLLAVRRPVLTVARDSATPKRKHFRDMVRIRNAPPETVQLEPGSRLVLQCDVFGKPAPSVQWLKNGEPIVDYEVESNDILPAHPSSLALLTSKLVVSSSANGDVYTCVATSALNQKSASTTVFTVEGNDEENLLTLQKLFRMPTKPVITTFYTNVFQDIGSDLILPCRVDSNSQSQVFWQDKNNELIFGNSRMRVLPSGDLVISPLLWSDMGNFSCIAKNMYGKDTMETFVYPLKPSKS